MIKAVLIHSDKTKTIFFGLSARNLDLLRQKRPIMIESAELGIPGVNVVIQGGETEDEIAAELRTQIDIPVDPV